MKNILKDRIILPSLCLVFALAFTSCSDWTKTDSLTIKQPSIETQNPELYAQYVANLNAYKKSEHKIMYVTFDNSNKVPASRAHHISTVPDSVDIISLIYPDKLVDRELEEMQAVREKGTKVIYTIAYAEIELSYKQDKKAFDDEAAANTPEGEPAPEFMDFATYLTSYLDSALTLGNKYNYDGLTLSYHGRNIHTMTEEEKADYIAIQEIVLSKVSAWHAANSSKILNFEGWANYLIDVTLLSSCKYILVPTQDAKSAFAYTSDALLTLKPGVPTNNIIVVTQTFSLDKTDVKKGYFLDGTSAILGAAYWTATDDAPFTKAGIAIYGVQTDYYNTSLVYKYTREALSIMNPSPKN